MGKKRQDNHDQFKHITDLLKQITDLCGSIHGNKSWTEASKLRLYFVLTPDTYNKQSTIRKELGPVFRNDKCLDLFKQLLTLNPANRISAENVLKHHLFKK